MKKIKKGAIVYSILNITRIDDRQICDRKVAKVTRPTTVSNGFVYLEGFGARYNRDDLLTIDREFSKWADGPMQIFRTKGEAEDYIKRWDLCKEAREKLYEIQSEGQWGIWSLDAESLKDLIRHLDFVKTYLGI